jgi:hypothetical protein
VKLHYNNLPTRNFLPEYVLLLVGEGRELFQRRLSETAKRAGIVFPVFVTAFQQALGEAYDTLVASKKSRFEQAHSLTASAISLMSSDDLEVGIHIGKITNRLGDTCGNARWRVQMRYMALLGRHDMSAADNPVGLDVIGTGLRAICRASGAPLKDNIALLNVIAEQLAHELPDIYRELNDLLAGLKVDTMSAGASPGESRQEDGVRTTGNAAEGDNWLFELQKLLTRQRAGSQGALQEISPRTAVGKSTRLAMLNELAERIDQLALTAAQRRLPKTASGTSGRAELTFLAKDLGLPMGCPEAIILDALTFVFEAIGDTQALQLPDVIKTIITSLQIPLLKLAIFDPSIFTNINHPARQLLNGIARAAVGLSRGVDREDPVCRQLALLADTVRDRLHRDGSALRDPLEELDGLIFKRDENIKAMGLAYLALLLEKEQCDTASAASRRWLSGIEQQGATPELLNILRQYWARLMEAAFLEDGEAGDRWQANHTTIADLLWSVANKETAEERKSLVRLVPSLLERINAGLDKTDISTEERAAFLDAIYELQTAALRGKSPPAVQFTDQPSNDDLGQVLVSALEGDGKKLKMLAHARTEALLGGESDRGVRAGNWLTFSMNESEELYGLICWKSECSGSTLLFNPVWGFAVGMSGSVLAQQLGDGRAHLIASRPIVDIAAQSVINAWVGS